MLELVIVKKTSVLVPRQVSKAILSEQTYLAKSHSRLDDLIPGGGEGASQTFMDFRGLVDAQTMRQLGDWFGRRGDGRELRGECWWPERGMGGRGKEKILGSHLNPKGLEPKPVS